MSDPIVGETVNITALVYENGLLTDPTGMTLVVTDPNGTVTTYLWPSGSVIVHGYPPITNETSTLGAFYAPIVVLVPGQWTFVWTASGVVTAGPITGAFNVDAIPITVTIHVQDVSSNPLSGANVAVYANASTVVAGGYTNGSGNFVCSILPSPYEIELTLSKCVFANPSPITVAASPSSQTFTLTGTPLTISDPVRPKTVRLFGYIWGSDGRPAEARITVTTVSYGNYRPFVQPPTTDTGIDPQNVAIMSQHRELKANSVTGYWECDVVADAMVRVEIPEIRLNKLFRVPNDPLISSINLKDVRPDPGTQNETGVSNDNGGVDGIYGAS